MIKKARVKNFQSHQDSEIEFDENITTLIGVSDSGKSAIVRSLSCLTKRGPFYIRNGEESGEVGIVFDNGSVSRNVNYPQMKKCSNCKEPIQNSDSSTVVCKCGEVNTPKVDSDFYLIDGKTKMEKFGVRLPDDIKKVIKMSPVVFVDNEEDLNFTSQFDDHFFVGQTYAGSKRNKIISALIVDAEKVDLLIQKISSEYRDSNARFQLYQSETLLKKEKVAKVTDDIVELKRLKTEIDNDKSLEISLKYTKLHAIHEELSKLKPMDTIQENVKKISIAITKLKDLFNSIKNSTKEYQKLLQYKTEIEKIKVVEFVRFIPATDKLENDLLRSRKYKIESYQDRLSALDEAVRSLQNSQKSITENITVLTNARNEMVDKMQICPVTKKPLHSSCKDAMKGISNG